MQVTIESYSSNILNPFCLTFVLGLGLWLILSKTRSGLTLLSITDSKLGVLVFDDLFFQTTTSFLKSINQRLFFWSTFLALGFNNPVAGVVVTLSLDLTLVFTTFFFQLLVSTIIFLKFFQSLSPFLKWYFKGHHLISVEEIILLTKLKTIWHLFKMLLAI